MTGFSGPNDIVDLVANYCQATDDFFNKLYNVLKNFFTFGPETKSAKSDTWLSGGPVTSVTGDQVCYLSEHGFKSLVLDVQA